jgi:hypothetical protein
MIVEREQEMLAAAEDLRFELAARLRDELADLRRELAELGGEGDDGDAEPAERRRGQPAPVPRSSARRAARGRSGR